MNRGIFYLDENVIKTKKSCRICIHIDVCKFHAKAKELFNSNEFYEMKRYLEHNNNLSAWEDNSSCDHYSSFFNNKPLLLNELKKDRSTINTFNWHDIFQEWIRLEVYPHHKEHLNELIRIEGEKSYHKNVETSVENLLRHVVQTSSSNHTFTVKIKDSDIEYTIGLSDLLDYFKAFN